MEIVARVAAESSKNKEFKVSPRTVGKAYKIIVNNNNDLNAMYSIIGLDKKIIFDIIKAENNVRLDLGQAIEIEELGTRVKNLLEISKTVNSAIKLMIITKKIQLLVMKLENMAHRDANVEMAKEVLSIMKHSRRQVYLKAKSNVAKNVPSNSLAAQIKNAVSSPDNFNWELIKIPDEDN